MQAVGALEAYFSPFREQIVGRDQFFESPFGPQRIVYADWTASGRAYRPIEDRLRDEVLPFYGNTHTGVTMTGKTVSRAYGEAKEIVREHVHASPDDVVLFCGSGMTAAVAKLQRILGARCSEAVVFVTHMEHHSNLLGWLEKAASVETIRPSADGNVDLDHLAELLDRYKDRKLKIASVTACSNVTGIRTPIHRISALMHAHGGLCFVDFACSAPYVAIDMHPAVDAERLDAIFFSFHKFLGGPGAPGLLVFDRALYRSPVPDQPGGGTVLYTNPWHDRLYVSDIGQREDAGTPAILQAVKAALCIRLKEQMGVKHLLAREREMVRSMLWRLGALPGVTVLEPGCRDRLGVVSFTVRDAHHNLVVRMLNDRFGVQARGGCSCAGPYGHYLLGIDRDESLRIREALRMGKLWYKPGWIRLSVHPTMTDAEIDYLMDAVEMTVGQYPSWKNDYSYDPGLDEYEFDGFADPDPAPWFRELTV